VTDTEQQHEARAAAAHIAAADPVFGDVVKTSELVHPLRLARSAAPGRRPARGLGAPHYLSAITTLVALSMFEQLLESLHQLDDTEAQATLVSLRGIGPWSAQMFLLHELKRPDVFPAGDIGLRTAVARLDGLDNTPAVKRAADRAMIWSPYRSYAAAYLWRWSR
jgi:3-methyladenine DNA glycosylase/8-oxoguanine DNA glycosylase